MTLRTQRRLLWTLAAALALAAAAAGTGLCLAPLERFDAATGVPPPPTERERAEEAGDRPLSAYAVIYGRDWQRPLYDPKPAPKEAAPPPEPPVTLVGTVIEEGFTVAMLRTRSGPVKMVRTGQTVEGTEVLEVTSDGARVRYAGHEHALTLEKGKEGS